MVKGKSKLRRNFLLLTSNSLLQKLTYRSNTMRWSCYSSGMSPNMLTLKHSSSVVQNELTGWEGNLSLYTTLESFLICSFKNTDLSVKKIIFPLPHYPARPCRPYGGFCLVLQIFAEFHLRIPAELQIRRRISTKFLLLTCKMGNAPNNPDFKFGVFQCFMYLSTGLPAKMWLS